MRRRPWAPRGRASHGPPSKVPTRRQGHPYLSEVDGWRLVVCLVSLVLLSCEGAAIAHPADATDPYERPCTVAGDCPGRKCIRLRPNLAGLQGLCSRACRNDADCGERAGCFDLGRAGPTCLARCGPELAAGYDTVGETAASPSDCAEGLRCLAVGASGERACFVEPLPRDTAL